MLDDDKVIGLLMRANLLSPFSLNQAKRIQKGSGAPLLQVLLEHQLVDEDRALQAIGPHTSTPCVSLGEFDGDPELLARVPRSLAEAYRVLPIGLMQDERFQRLFLAMADPTDLLAMESIAQATGLEVEPVLVGPRDLKDAIARCYDVPVDEVDLSGSSEVVPDIDTADLEWVDIDTESHLFLETVLAEPEPPPATKPVPLDPDKLSPPKMARPKGPEKPPVKANDFREFMTRSAVAILSPLEREVLQSSPSSQVGSKELLQAVVRLLIRAGIISEKDILDELAAKRRRLPRTES